MNAGEAFFRAILALLVIVIFGLLVFGVVTNAILTLKLIFIAFAALICITLVAKVLS